MLLIEVLSIAVFTGLQHSSATNETKRSLKSEAEYVAAGYTGRGADFFKKIERNSGDRITVISSNGTVIYDTYFDIAKLGDHSGRPEVKEALKDGSGYSERYSNDMRGQTIYYALRMDDGDIMRLSTERDTIWQIYIDMRYQLIALLSLTMLVTLVLAYGLSKSLVEPINRIDPRHPLEEETYPELSPLTERIDQQNRQIDEQIRELESTVEQKTREAEFRSEFTANVSHSLKTPLTSISGYAELIKEGIAKEEDIKPFAGRIYDESGRLRSLVDDIMTITKLDDESTAYVREQVDLYTLCEKAVAELEPVAAAKGVTFTLRGNNFFIEGVEDILYEMIFNICDNAVRYNVDGGRVDIEVAERSVRPYVKVSDTGIGIPQKDRDRVFERFFMVDKSHSREVGGTGLGLAIVKHGAKFHGAEIELESEIGKGTTITIEF